MTLVSPHKLSLAVLALCCFLAVGLATPSRQSGPVPDWLIEKVTTPATVTKWTDGMFKWVMPGKHGITLSNGLISRVFLMEPDFATVDFHSASRDASLLRAIKPEAVVTLKSSTGAKDERTYNIGGLTQSTQHAYLNRTDLSLALDPDAFHFVSFDVAAPTTPVPWTPGSRHSPKDAAWPPLGVHLSVLFKAPASAPADHAHVEVTVHYEMYQGIPLLSKWVSVANEGGKDMVTVSKVTLEYLAVNSPYAPLKFSSYPPSSRIEDRSGYLFAEADIPHVAIVDWQDDPTATIDTGAGEPVLNCTYSTGPGVHLRDGGAVFVSYRCHELVTDTDDKERYALSIHQKTRTLAPWTMENPIFFHATNVTKAGFRAAVDQLQEVGFDMIIYSFGSGFQFENVSQANLDAIKADVDYAKARGIEVSGYDLIMMDRGHGGYGGNVGDEWSIVGKDGKLTPDACFASGWTDKLEGMMYKLIEYTGLSGVETDGPYNGVSCGSTTHAHHEDWEDSAYQQTLQQNAMYHEFRRRGVFINQPDNFFFQGGNKAPLGYNENQFSLPRWEDISVSRQSVWEGTYNLLPSQGWMFVPLIEYHGGGDAATFEPLAEHLVEYEWALAQYLGYGVAACYRGNRIYDTPATKALVTKWVSFYKKYRDIINSNVIHVRRPDMQGIDSMMHVNPHLNSKGLAMVFNPTDAPVSESLSLPTYYTGLKGSTLVREQEGPAKSYTIENDHIDVQIDLPAKGITWFLITAPAGSAPAPLSARSGNLRVNYIP